MLLLIMVLFDTRILMLFKVAYGVCESCYIKYSAQEMRKVDQVTVVVEIKKSYPADPVRCGE
jgi:GTP:adenosylcobinamide-phosphate guanylyltransferase